MLFQISPSTNATQNLLLGSNKWAYTTTKGGDNLQQLAVTSKRILLFENTILSKKDKDKDKGKDRWGVPFAEIIFGWKCLADFGCTPPPLRKKIQNSIWLLPSDRVDYSWQSEADSQRVTFNNSCDFFVDSDFSTQISLISIQRWWSCLLCFSCWFFRYQG